MSEKSQMQVLRDIQATLDKLIEVLERPLPAPKAVEAKPKRHRHRRPEEVEKLRAEARALRASGMRVSDIGRRLGISAAYVAFLAPAKDIF